MSSSRELLRELLGRENPVEGLRVFAGHAGWAPGQLESEVARGDWHLVTADARMVLEMEPEKLWKELERRASATTVRYEHPAGRLRHAREGGEGRPGRQERWFRETGEHPWAQARGIGQAGHQREGHAHAGRCGNQFSGDFRKRCGPEVRVLHGAG